jgi:hypothetical protein
MISVPEFERVQTLLGRPNRPRPKQHVFAYTGLLHCGNCGGSITAEEKVNRHGSHYTYYHCIHKRPGIPCQEKSIEERRLEEQLVEFLDHISVSEKEQDEALAIIDEELKKEQHVRTDPREAAAKELSRCRKELDTLTKLRYRELIEDEEFARQRAELLQQQASLNQRLGQLEGQRWLEPSRNFFLFNNRAVFWLTHGGPAEKRLIIATVGSNPRLISKKLNIDAHNPFTLLDKPRESSHWWAIVNDVITFFKERPEIVIPLLPEPEGRMSPLPS